MCRSLLNKATIHKPLFVLSSLPHTLIALHTRNAQSTQLNQIPLLLSCPRGSTSRSERWMQRGAPPALAAAPHVPRLRKGPLPALRLRYAAEHCTRRAAWLASETSPRGACHHTTCACRARYTTAVWATAARRALTPPPRGTSAECGAAPRWPCATGPPWRPALSETFGS